MKTYLLIDEESVNYYYARRTEEELNPTLIEGMNVGDLRPCTPDKQRFFVTRES